MIHFFQMSDVTPSPVASLQFNPKSWIVNGFLGICFPLVRVNMFDFWLNSVFLCLLVNFSRQNPEFGNLLYHKRGNVSIVGIFNDRVGSDCGVEIGKGLEEIASAIWTVEALNNYEYLPGVTVGLSVFGICENSNSSKGLPKEIEEFLDFYEDDNFIGILTTPETHTKLSTSDQLSSRNFVHVEHVISIDMLADATIQILINLRWMNVCAVISDSAEALELFSKRASDEGVVVEDEVLMDARNPSSLPEPSRKARTSSLVVVIAAFATISSLAEKMQEKNIKLILTPTDFVFDVSLLDLPEETIVSLPSMETRTKLSGYVKNVRKDFIGKPPAKGPLFVETAASILNLLKPVKEKFEELCESSEQPCAPVSRFMDALGLNKTGLASQKSMKISPDDMEKTLKVLKIEPRSNDEMFLYITSVINANASEDLAIFQIFSLETKTFQPVLLMISEDLLSAQGGEEDKKIEYFDETFKFGQEDVPRGDPVMNLLQKLTTRSPETFKSEYFENVTSPKTLSENGCGKQGHKCQDSSINHTATTQPNSTTAVAWRFLTWVSINTSLGFVGVTCTLSTMFFIVIRLCKDDMVEGSPCFTLLLMVAVILTYLSSLPFHVDLSPESGYICSYRKNGPPVVFAALFSLLLSRSVVRAFGETGGELESHINGYLQSTLCFFMIGVQVSIISQNWIFEKENYDSSCADVHDKYKIIFSLGYDFLLLILLACVSPFIIRSKQNYKEGLLFSISVFFITVVWSTWISLYVLLPNEEKDAAVAIGLNSTASVLLFCIFIPQTYLMAGPFARDPLRSLSSLDRNILAGVSNFKSSQALNENAFGTITYKNCDQGLSNPNFLSNPANGSAHPNRNDNFPGETIVDVSPETSQPI